MSRTFRPRLVYTPMWVGVVYDVALQSTRSQFVFGATTLDLGEGVTVLNVTVSDGYNAVMSILVEPDAEAGSETL